MLRRLSRAPIPALSTGLKRNLVVCIDTPIELAIVPEAIQVGNRFTQRKRELMQVQLAPKQHFHDFNGWPWGCTGF